MSTPKGRILCTEDHPDTRELIILALTQAGFEAECADDPHRLLDLAKSGKFNLFLVDTWMPRVSGLELCKQIREFDGETPILFLSGAALETDKAAALAAGAQGYLVKPIALEVLVNEVTRLATN